MDSNEIRKAYTVGYSDAKFEQDMERKVIAGPILDLVRENPDLDKDELWDELYDSEEMWNAFQNALDWAYDYVNKYEG